MQKTNIRTVDIVIIEDDYALGTLIELKLKKEGYNIHLFRSGKEGIEFLKQNQNVFLILDYQLSDMLSRDVVIELKKSEINIPFIVMTGNGDEKVAVEMMKLGAMEYIIKELGFIDMLPVVISRCLRKIETELLLEESKKEIEKREEKYRRIFENIQDVYFELDGKGLIKEISPSVLKTLGYYRTDVIGKRFFKYLIGTGVKKLIRDLLSNTEISDYETIIKNKNNGINFISVSCKIVNTSEGKKFIGILRDITYRKKLEHYLLNVKFHKVVYENLNYC
ncbi:MAG: hypothetical protein Kow0068_14200 [Marinilabiliales bacterium]